MSRNEEVEAWYKAHASKIKKWANKRSKQDAEDILQDTAVKLLTSPSKWEAITTRNVTRWAMFEYYKGIPEFIEIEDSTVPENITETLIAKKSIEVIQELVDSLNGASKEIFIMHFFKEMDYLEIAEKLDMTHCSVKQLGSRAKKIIVSKFNNIINKGE